MLKRRSTRKFNSEKITKDELDKILQAALLAPTSMNRKPCNFLVVERPETLKELSRCKNHGADLIAGADKAIVVIADAMIADTWCEDSSIALTYMHLMAAEQDIGSCWVQIHLRTSKSGKPSEEYVREVLGIDDYFRIVGILALGVPFYEVKGYKIEDIDKERVHYFCKE